MSFQQSISVSTLESFERTPVQKKLPSSHKQAFSNEVSSQPTNRSEATLPTGKTGTHASKETVEGTKNNSKTDEASPAKEILSVETSLKDSDFKTDKPTPTSKTLPANKQVTSDNHEGKSETRTHPSSSKSKPDEKKQAQPVTPNKDKTFKGQEKTLKESTPNQSSDFKTNKLTPSSSKTLPAANKQVTPVSHEGRSETMSHPSSKCKPDEKKQGQPVTPNNEVQEITATTKEASSQQDNTTPSTTGQSTVNNTSSSQTVTHSTGDKDTSSDPSMHDPSQPVVTSPTNPDDFVIVDLVDGPVDVPVEVPVEVPVSEFFPVSHVTLNHDDWSLCVANTGLCVLIYSFHPIMTSSVPIKVCTVSVAGLLCLVVDAVIVN